MNKQISKTKTNKKYWEYPLEELRMHKFLKYALLTILWFAILTFFIWMSWIWSKHCAICDYSQNAYPSGDPCHYAAERCDTESLNF